MSPAQQEAVGVLLGVADHPGRIVHRYDQHGRRIETRRAVFGPLGEDMKTVAYNEHGDPSEVVEESNHGEMQISDEGQLIEMPDKRRARRSEARFRYEYDAHGNWTSKV